MILHIGFHLSLFFFNVKLHHQGTGFVLTSLGLLAGLMCTDCGNPDPSVGDAQVLDDICVPSLKRTRMPAFFVGQGRSAGTEPVGKADTNSHCGDKDHLELLDMLQN